MSDAPIPVGTLCLIVHTGAEFRHLLGTQCTVVAYHPDNPLVWSEYTVVGDPYEYVIETPTEGRLWAPRRSLLPIDPDDGVRAENINEQPVEEPA